MKQTNKQCVYETPAGPASLLRGPTPKSCKKWCWTETSKGTSTMLLQASIVHPYPLSPTLTRLSSSYYDFNIHSCSYLFIVFMYLKGECVCHCVSVCDYVGSVFECYSQREKVCMRECAPWMVTRPARASYKCCNYLLLLLLLLLLLSLHWPHTCLAASTTSADHWYWYTEAGIALSSEMTYGFWKVLDHGKCPICRTLLQIRKKTTQGTGGGRGEGIFFL